MLDEHSLVHLINLLNGTLSAKSSLFNGETSIHAALEEVGESSRE